MNAAARKGIGVGFIQCHDGLIQGSTIEQRRHLRRNLT